MTTPALLGEVIAASTGVFTAQCIESPRPDTVTELPDPPPFGAFVRIGMGATGPSDAIAPVPPLPEDYDPFEDSPPHATRAGFALPDGPLTLYGVVCQAVTGSIEPGRPVTAFGLPEEELRAAQPQIYELLATYFSAVLVAHVGPDGVLRPYLPPRPPRPHAFVWAATPAETRMLTERFDYLRTLLSSGGPGGGVVYSPDELVAALLRHAAATAYPGDRGFLLRAGRELAALLPLEYDRLRALIRRITPE